MTEQTVDKTLLHPRIQKVLQDSVNPKKCVKLPIVKGKCPGIRAMEMSQFPPKGVHQDVTAVTFTIRVKDGKTYPLTCRVNAIIGYDPSVIVGFVSHTQADKLRKESQIEVKTEHFFMVIEASLNAREGFVCIYKDLYESLCKLAALSTLTELRSVEAWPL